MDIHIQDIRDHKWYTVSEVSFRFWKNHASDGTNKLVVLTNDGCKLIEDIFIEEIKFSIW